MSGGGWLMMILSTLALWALVVLVGLAIYRAGSTGRSASSGRNPQQILDERLARGEIDPDEYRARQELLRASPR
jgi:putative membrane protein